MLTFKSSQVIKYYIMFAFLFVQTVLKKNDKKTLKIVLLCLFYFLLFIFVSLPGMHRLYTNGAYIKRSTKVLSGIALIHVSGDFFFCWETWAMCRYRAGLLGFVSCVVLLLATINFAVMFAPVLGRGPAHLSDRYSDFQQRFCRFSDSD